MWSMTACVVWPRLLFMQMMCNLGSVCHFTCSTLARHIQLDVIPVTPRCVFGVGLTLRCVTLWTWTTHTLPVIPARSSAVHLVHNVNCGGRRKRKQKENILHTKRCCEAIIQQHKIIVSLTCYRNRQLPWWSQWSYVHDRPLHERSPLNKVTNCSTLANKAVSIKHSIIIIIIIIIMIACINKEPQRERDWTNSTTRKHNSFSGTHREIRPRASWTVLVFLCCGSLLKKWEHEDDLRPADLNWSGGKKVQNLKCKKTFRDKRIVFSIQ